MTPRYVLWDLDGTLVDSGPDIVWSANEARRSFGLEPLSEEVIHTYVGEGAPRLMQRVMGEDAGAAMHKAGLERFLELYADHLAVRTKPYEGIDALVRSLKGRQSIVTNKPGGLARRLVSLMGWDDLFGAVLGGGDVPHKKPAPDIVLRALELAEVPRTNAVLVGDTLIDVETARAANVDSIIVSWGLRPREELLTAPRLVDDMDTLRRLLEE